MAITQRAVALAVVGVACLTWLILFGEHRQSGQKDDTTLDDAHHAGEIVFERNEMIFDIVQVIDYHPAQTPALRFLRSGRSIVGADFISEEYEDQSAFLNFAILQMVQYNIPKPTRILALGLGAATVVGFLRKNGFAVDVVEFCEGIVDAASAHFNFNSNNGTHGRLWIEDAEIFLQRDTPDKYDVVIHDLFNGLNPLKLLRESIISKIKSRWLKPNGVLLVNFFGYHQQSNLGHLLSSAVQATLETTFDGSVRCYREIPHDMFPELPANLIFVSWINASDVPAPERPPFPVPNTPDYMSPPELSTFWVQKHYHTFEVTAHLRTSDNFPNGQTIIDHQAPKYTKAARSIDDEYQQLVIGMYPPAKAWF
eukprot:m.40856 g.40856  ORF g.40856 m.40856 type:complete len:368 (+) comp18635_c0_seq2:414-1517(+)